MDFINRGGQARTNNVTSNASGSADSAAAPNPPASKAPLQSGGNPSNGHNHGTFVRIGFLILLFAGTILAVAALIFLAFGKGSYRESTYVNHKQLQAVFINVNGTNGGQVYFGNIQELTPQFIRLTNVFYIQNQQANAQSTSAYNLIKLGCELHGPEDSMMINRREVFFWENLKSDSQVAQKVAEFHKQNPDGQKCNKENSQTQQQPANTQTPASGTPAPAANANNAPAPAPATPAPAQNNPANRQLAP